MPLIRFLSAAAAGLVALTPVESHVSCQAPLESQLKSASIILERSGCYGNCPAYRIKLKGDGSATYSGYSSVLITGVHRFRVPRADIRELFERLRAANFCSLNDKYIGQITDLPTYTVTLIDGDLKKCVTDYAGERAGMPSSVTALEDDIDRIGANRFVRGDGHTIATLRSENFDFHSAEAATLLADAAESAPDEVVLDLLAAGTPPTGSGRSSPFRPFPPTAIMNAARSGRIKSVRALIAAGAFASDGSGPLSGALYYAVTSGDPDTVAEILKHNPNPKTPFPGASAALQRVRDIEQGDVEKRRYALPIAVMLLAAGADPNAIDGQGETAVFQISDVGLLNALLKAGAKIDVRNYKGETPLLTVWDDDCGLALIAAGADVTAVAKDGTTAYSHAHQYALAKTQELLERKKVAN